MHKPKHLEYAAGTASSGNQVELFSEKLPEAVNIHGVRGTLTLATATSTTYIGVNWALMCIPEIVGDSSQVPSLTDANMNSDALQGYIWASGKDLVYTGHVTRVEFELKTSRNCEKGAYLIFAVKYENAIAGTTPTLQALVGMQWWESQI